MSKQGQDKIYQMITDRILAEMEKGVIPWRKPWRGTDAPLNLISKKNYRGINTFLLSCAGFGSPYWLSYKQAKQKGGQVKKGEQGYPVVFWKFLEFDKEDPDTGEIKKKRFPMLRYYTVFNAEQCEGIKLPPTHEENGTPFEPIETAQTIADNFPGAPPVEHGGGRACYSPSKDVIRMPPQDDFESPEEYYCALFHEQSHSTGHKSRLNRNMENGFGSHDYSKEELVAEFAAAFLCGISGIEKETLKNSAAYIQNWATKLKSNPKWAVCAAAAGQKAADHIQDIKFEEQKKAA